MSVAQIALAWLLHQPQVTSVIVGAKRAGATGRQHRVDQGGAQRRRTAGDSTRSSRTAGRIPGLDVRAAGRVPAQADLRSTALAVHRQLRASRPPAADRRDAKRTHYGCNICAASAQERRTPARGGATAGLRSTLKKVVRLCFSAIRPRSIAKARPGDTRPASPICSVAHRSDRYWRGLRRCL